MNAGYHDNSDVSREKCVSLEDKAQHLLSDIDTARDELASRPSVDG